MRRLFLLSALVVIACSKDDEEDGFVVQATVIQVSPEAFLGRVPCGATGGMQRYQATLVDVTGRSDAAFELPYSKVEPCTSALNFEYVREGHHYIARVVGFDRSDISAQNPGSSIVVDKEGKSVTPRWTTTCWGRDGEDPPEISLGGASSEEDEVPLGGESGFGAVANLHTIVVVRGCETLTDSEGGGTTAVSFDWNGALANHSCGSQAGEVDRFVVRLTDGALGGGGGAGGSSNQEQSGACDEELTVGDLPADEYLDFEAFAYEAGKDTPTWVTSCEALTIEGVVVTARCGLLAEL